ncbi:unnamed protein product [Adineta ricciae]|uniref:Uncharacterized protein n=1 Tax=Adineta ricciae TaxID=249248 RepID=A0A814MQC5_ADIRI|nr:unnamed protein product [Adineta ricciae]
MSKFISRLFRSNSSSSSNRRSPHGSQLSINESSRHGGFQTNMRAASSMDNLASYLVNPKELEKSKLHKASWEGNLQKVQSLARPNVIDTKDQHARTPLHLAVARGNLEVVKYLVHEGAKLDVMDQERRTPLIKAVLSNTSNPSVSYEICVRLLDGGADAFINAVDINQKNALHYAVDFEQEKLVDLFLLVRNCDPNFPDGNQMTPLHLAVDRKCPNIVRILLSEQHRQQVDLNLTNRNGQTPLHMAAVNGDAQIVRYIIEADLEEPCDPGILDPQQLTALQLAQKHNHIQCIKLLSDYQQQWPTLNQHKQNRSGSISEQVVSSAKMDLSRRLEDDDDDTDDSTTSSDTTSRSSSKASSRQLPRPLTQRSEQSVSSLSTSQPPQRSLADMIKSNPLQPDISKNNAAKATNRSLAGLINANPLQRNEDFQSKPAATQQKQPIPPPPPSMFSTTSISSPQHKDLESSSTSVSVEKSIIGMNLLAEQPSLRKKNVTIDALVKTIPATQPVGSNSNSWTHDSTSVHEQGHIVQAKKVDTWDDDSVTQSDDDDTGVYRPKSASASLPKQQPFLSLSGTSMFITAQKEENDEDSRSDEDSIEAAIRKQTAQNPSNGIQNLVTQQIGNKFPAFPAQSSIPISPPPLSDDSSWSTDSVKQSNPSATKGLSSLIQQQPLHQQQMTESNLDDSRPLSADLKQQSTHSTSTTSSDSDDEQNEKAQTIVKSPFSHGVLTNLVQMNIHPAEPTEIRSTGIDNLTKIMNDIKNSAPPHPKQPTLPNTISKIVASPLLQRSDSLSSNASSLLNDTIRSSILPDPGNANSKPTLFGDGINTKHWSATTTDRHDFGLLSSKHSSEMIQQTHQQFTRSSIHHDFNNLRGSMSSSTSSIQNNIERLSELKEDIKQIERKQEDSRELKRQLKDMEAMKNNFEALFKKNDQLLRETETKLEKEINEKQRLEWTTKNLNMELKSIKQKLQSLEDEKDILNQRCLKLKDERDNYDEKLRIHQVNALQASAAGVLREEDIEKIKSRHREEMKLLSAENDDLHQRTKQLQSDLQLHKESLDVTIRYKIDLEKALEEKLFLQRELDRLKHEKDFIEQEKTDYKTKYDSLQDEIRALILDRSRLEQKLTHELEEQTKQTQRSTDDSKKYKAQIEQLNIKLGEAEARLLVLQSRNEAILASKDEEIKNGLETLTQRLNMIESEKLHAEQRYQNERQHITNKQQQQSQQHTPPTIHESLVILTSPSMNNGNQHQPQSSPSPSCTKCDVFQRNFEQEREQRVQAQKDNERLRDTVSRQEQQQQQQHLSGTFQKYQSSDHLNVENNRQIRSDTERMKYEIDRLRHDFDKLVSNYDSPKLIPQQQQQQLPQLYSQADALRQLYEQELREKQLLMMKLNDMTKVSRTPTPPPTANNGYHHMSSPVHHHHHHSEYDYLVNGKSTCSICSNSRLLKERLENAIDTCLADQRIQTIRQMPILPRQTSALLPTNTNGLSSADILRKRYYV